MKKRTWVFAILLILALLFGGCRSSGGNVSGTEGAPDQTAPTEVAPTTPTAVKAAKISCQYLPGEVEAPEGVPVLRWVCLTDRLYGGGERVWSEEAAREVNEMLAEKEMPFRIQFVMLTMGKWLSDSQWFARPEAQEALQDADLIYGRMNPDAMRQYLSPITSYATGEASPSLENAVPHRRNWVCGTLDGEIYGIPAVPGQAGCNGWSVDEALLKGRTDADFAKAFWEMDDLFAEIYKENGNKPFLYISSNGYLQSEDPAAGTQKVWMPNAVDDMLSDTWQYIGACFAVDYSGERPTVVNYLETQEARLLQEAASRYSKAGYVTQNSQALLKYTTVRLAEAYNDAGRRYIPVTDLLYERVKPYDYLSGVAASSGHKAEALSLLNLIAEDEEFRMLLFHGKEGRDYTVNGDGYYEIVIREDGSSYSLSMLSPLSYFSGLTADRKTSEFLNPGAENWFYPAADGMTPLETLQAGAENSILCCPIIFDYTGFREQTAAMAKIFATYFPSFSVMPSERYGQMLSELKEAGSDEILAALQAQLDAWLEK